MSSTRKVYRIESFAIEKARRSCSSTQVQSSDDVADVRHQQILDQLESIQKSIVPQHDVSKLVVTEFRREMEEASKLKVELDEIYNAINKTKVEIASLHNTSFDPDQMGRVANELDAIVNGTEHATETILASAEGIDERAAEILPTLTGNQKEGLEDIQEKIVQIFEACNFQDLTGQRITKVVNTLKFVEDRIDRMMEIWGGIQAFQDVDVITPDERAGDEALLNGPALQDEEGIASQDDIDALFA